MTAAATVALVLAGCRSPPDPGMLSAAGTTALARPVINAGVAPPVAVTAGQVSLIQESASGYGPIDAGTTAARRSIDMTMYELPDPTAQADLIAAHRQGSQSGVTLDRAFHGQQVNQDPYTQLTAAGVAVHWAPTGQIIHQETITIDGARALIGTGNLTARYYPSTRDAWIDDRNPAQVCTPSPPPPRRLGFTTALRTAGGRRRAGLAPGAGQQITAYLGTARRSVEFTSEELSDPHVVAPLVVGASMLIGSQNATSTPA